MADGKATIPRILAFAYIYCPKTGRVLVEHRICDQTYGIPGGGVDPGEDLYQAVLREIEEETGFKAKLESLVPLCDYDCSIDGLLRHAHIYAIEVDEEFTPVVPGEDLPPLSEGQTLKSLFSALYADPENKTSYKESFSLSWIKPVDWPEPMHPHLPKSLGQFSSYMAEGAEKPAVIVRDGRKAGNFPAILSQYQLTLTL